MNKHHGILARPGKARQIHLHALTRTARESKYSLEDFIFIACSYIYIHIYIYIYI